ncbi:MAG: class I tRNA ligase family protein, partial [Candidatus Diapherotrites archaeon]|nr:class I tRNA ligase family protein [Candidatus Diapherotrites archaeon]
MQEINLPQITEFWQKQWQKKGIATAIPNKKQKKFFLIFAYPGISGFLHVGHMRGFTYSDVFTRFKRMQGFNVLFPVGFHASGLPSVAYAKKVERKDEATIQQLKDFGLNEKQIKELEVPE